jgi:mannitol-specific phosphotransferase system IIBC component
MQSKFENQLKKALKDAADADSHDPVPGHEERFEMRLLHQRDNRKMRRIPKWPVLAIAAACVAGFIVSIVVMEVRKTNEHAEQLRLSDVSGEMALTEAYYNDRLQSEMKGLNTSDRNIRKFMDDAKKLEEEYKMLEATLAKNVHDERIAQAMVNNYKFRLKLMEQLQKYIEIQNKFNSNDQVEKLSS